MRQIVLKYGQSLGFFDKKGCIFEEKLEFFKISKAGKFAVQCVSNDIIYQKYHFST